MNSYFGYAMIIGVCIIVLAIVAFRKRAEFILNFLFRAVSGTIAIYLVNQILPLQQQSMSVGINPLTVLTSGSLGIPGVLLLYGINFIQLL